jgi:hypothetical protein
MCTHWLLLETRFELPNPTCGAQLSAPPLAPPLALLLLHGTLVRPVWAISCVLSLLSVISNTALSPCILIWCFGALYYKKGLSLRTISTKGSLLQKDDFQGRHYKAQPAAPF